MTTDDRPDIDTDVACTDWEPRLLAYVEERLAGDERAAVMEHLAACDDCRRAVGDARAGMAHLGHLADAPLPFPEPEATGASRASEAAWRRFVGGLGERRRARWRLVDVAARGAAAAALLMMGAGLGYLHARASLQVLPVQKTTVAMPIDDAPVLPAVSEEAVDSLARAELLADLGVDYVHGLQDTLGRVMDESAAEASPAALARARERALELIRDGRVLRRTLDPQRDRRFVAAIDRAELMLEEIAVIGEGDAGTAVGTVRAEIASGGLQAELAGLDVEGEVSRALAASGWIAAPSRWRVDS